MDALVGAVAPNLDVAVGTNTDKGILPVAEPGDWLRISDVDLLYRLNPALERGEADIIKASRTLMQPITDTAGQVFGRAFIWPVRHYFSTERGWVTISGFRAAPLSNVGGVLLGEALTASRDSAKPLATEEAMASWATNQAEMIGASVKDEKRQARSAEVVLECGGEIGDLKIVKWGSEWMSESEVEEKLRGSTELAISFDGEFDYDEDKDDVHPRNFLDNFDVADDIALVLNYDGSILKIGKQQMAELSWRGSKGSIFECSRLCAVDDYAAMG